MTHAFRFYVIFLCSASLIAPALADDTAPERAWFVTLKTDAGKKAKIGRYGDHEGQALMWFEDSDKPKDKKLILAPPKAFLEHTTCATSTPDPSKAMTDEEGWWLFESKTRHPIALQVSFDGASLWRYDAAQKCLIQWPVPKPAFCRYGPAPQDKTDQAADTPARNLDQAQFLEISTAGWDRCPQEALRLSEITLDLKGDAPGGGEVEGTKKVDEENDLWARALLSLPVSRDGQTIDTPFEAYVQGKYFYISKPIQKKEGEMSFPDPIFSEELFWPDHYGDASYFRASIWKPDEGAARLQLTKYLGSSQEGRDNINISDHAITNVYQWNAAKKRFQYVGKYSVERVKEGFSPDLESRNDLRSYYIYPFGDASSIAYRSRLSSKDNLGVGCSERNSDGEGERCREFVQSTRHSREIQWTVNINGHDFELITLKPKAIIEKK